MREDRAGEPQAPIEQPEEVLRRYPVRKSRKQKNAFRRAAAEYAGRLGYPCAEEKGSPGVRNLVIGDPEGAEYLIAAHYDTCARLPVPNFVTPCSLLWFLLYQMLIAMLIALPVMVASGVVGALTENPIAGTLTADVLFLAALWLMLRGPANPSNANDNTSGVVTVLEIMAALPEDLRGKVCFVLFDLEEAGMLGSAAYRRKHRKATRRQIIFNIDCVGEGEEILLFPTRKLKRRYRRRLEGWKETLPGREDPTDTGRSITLRDRGTAIYPSDQAMFPLGVGIAAFRRRRVLGLYLSRIHTPKDTVCQLENIRLIRDWLIGLIRSERTERTDHHADL